MSISIEKAIEISENKKEKVGIDKKKTIGWLISILVPFIVSFVPVTEVYTESLRLFMMITLFVILIIAFELLPQMIAAFLFPSLYLISGLVPVEIAFGSWTSTTVWMVLGGLVFSNVLEQCGLLRRIAYFVISKCGGTYAGALFGCFTIGIILNLVTFCYGWLVASPLVYSVCKAMNLKPSRESSLVCFAGTLGATGATMFLYYPAYYSIMETAVREFIPNYTMSVYASFMYNGIGIAFYALTLFILMKVYKTKKLDENLGKELFEKKYEELGKTTLQEKKAVGMIFLLLMYLFVSRFVGLPAAYGFMSVPFLMFLPGIEIGNHKTIEKLNFSMVFFVSACLGIGVVGNAVGFGEFLTHIVTPILDGRSSLFASTLFLVFGSAANFFMTPFAMLGGLSYPFAQIAVTSGMNPIAAVMILLFACEIVILPYQSAGHLMMYSFGMMPMKDFIKQQGLKVVIMLVGFVLVVYPMWNLFNLI